jgi:hypothetical protein
MLIGWINVGEGSMSVEATAKTDDFPLWALALAGGQAMNQNEVIGSWQARPYKTPHCIDLMSIFVIILP